MKYLRIVLIEMGFFEIYVKLVKLIILSGVFV